ncbi:cysteine peptidase family C39 domain-containing protein [Enterococcus cecorum]
MKFKGVLQHDKQDCGAACLVAIFKYYGISISMHTIREQLKINNN